MNRQQNNPAGSEKRRHSRISTSNIVGYVLFDKDKNKIEHGKGRTLNLSQSGTLLKTRNPLQGYFITLITFDLNRKQIKVRGRVTDTRESSTTGVYLTGVEFIGSKDEHIRAIVAFVKAYHNRKHSNSAKTAVAVTLS